RRLRLVPRAPQLGVKAGRLQCPADFFRGQLKFLSVLFPEGLAALAVQDLEDSKNFTFSSAEGNSQKRSGAIAGHPVDLAEEVGLLARGRHSYRHAMEGHLAGDALPRLETDLANLGEVCCPREELALDRVEQIERAPVRTEQPSDAVDQELQKAVEVE